MITIDRSNLGLMMEAGYIYLGMQRFKDARDVFEGVSTLAPDSEIPLVALGSVDFCQGKFSGAIRHYKKALKIDPKSVYAFAYMGEALFFMGKKAEAVAQLEAVNKMDPKGKAGDFARSLLDAIKKGFSPQVLSGVDEIKAYVKKKEGKK
jgi:tetratricopeptide (TPR) repeat protein